MVADFSRYPSVVLESKTIKLPRLAMQWSERFGVGLMEGWGMARIKVGGWKTSKCG
jgi:hypothetical protein